MQARRHAALAGLLLQYQMLIRKRHLRRVPKVVTHAHIIKHIVHIVSTGWARKRVAAAATDRLHTNAGAASLTMCLPAGLRWQEWSRHGSINSQAMLHHGFSARALWVQRCAGEAFEKWLFRLPGTFFSPLGSSRPSAVHLSSTNTPPSSCATGVPAAARLTHTATALPLLRL